MSRALEMEAFWVAAGEDTRSSANTDPSRYFITHAAFPFEKHVLVCNLSTLILAMLIVQRDVWAACVYMCVYVCVYIYRYVYVCGSVWVCMQQQQQQRWW